MVTDLAAIIPAEAEGRVTDRLTRLRDSTLVEADLDGVPALLDRLAAALIEESAHLRTT